MLSDKVLFSIVFLEVVCYRSKNIGRVHHRDRAYDSPQRIERHRQDQYLARHVWVQQAEFRLGQGGATADSFRGGNQYGDSG